MKKKEQQTRILLRSEDYISPDCYIVKIEAEHFICTSVGPNVPDSSEEDWDTDQEIDGGEIEI